MDLAIVILCWRSREHLPGLLRSIAEQKTSLDLEVVVCHNEAEPTSPRVAEVPPGLAISEIFSGANLGYGGGNNFAISCVRQRADPRYILALNSDVILHQGALEALVKWADENPGMAIVGAVHEDPARPGHRCFGGCRYNRMFSIITPNAGPSGRGIDYVHGAAVLLRGSAFPGPKVFSEDYFLFFEELELSEQARAMGKGIGYCPDCRISHFEGASRRGGHADFVPEVAEYFENLNALRYTRDRCPHYLPTVLLFRALAKPAWLCLRGDGARLRYWAMAIGDFARSRVRRFPFQVGWNLAPGRDRVVDSRLPGATE
jgi:N-acetylglucosaminyl-diphospho-decaprenol L-rhamnosyltransferase